MNTIIKNIKRRRTTRKFEETPVEREKLETIIDAGLWAPSGGNKQPWHFTVIQDKALMTRLNVATKEAAMKSDVDYVKNLAKNEKLDIFMVHQRLLLYLQRKKP